MVPLPSILSSRVPVAAPFTVGGAFALLMVNVPLCDVAQFPVVAKVPLKIPSLDVPVSVAVQAPGTADVIVAVREFPLTVPLNVPMLTKPPKLFPHVPVTWVPLWVKEAATGAVVLLMVSVPEYVEASVTGCVELLLRPPHARSANEAKHSIATVIAIVLFFIVVFLLDNRKSVDYCTRVQRSPRLNGVRALKFQSSVSGRWDPLNRGSRLDDSLTRALPTSL